MGRATLKGMARATMRAIIIAMVIAAVVEIVTLALNRNMAITAALC